MHPVSTVFLFICSCLLTTIVTLQFEDFAMDPAKLERIKKLTAIKVEILRKIGLPDRPYVAKPNKGRLSKKILGGIGNTISLVNEPRGDYYAEIQEVVSHSQIPENMTNVNVIQFKIVRDNQGRKLEVTSANLLVKIKYKRKSQGRKGKRRKLKFKTITLKLSTVDSEGLPITVVSSVTTKIRRTKWLKIALPATVIDTAMKRDDQNLYLHLHCDGCDKDARLILINGHRKKVKRNKRKGKRRKSKSKLRELKTRRSRRKRRLNRTRPFLILHTKVKYSRNKREAVVCTDNSTCCMENLIVDFSAIGWDDWIIAPNNFQTGVCEGACSNRNTCQETESTHLSILYTNNYGQIILTSLPNMIVTKCGCKLD